MTAVEIRPARFTETPRPPRRRGDVIRAYVALTKPRIIELLLITTIPTMMLAAHGMPGVWLVLATLVGGALSAGSANTLNCYLDRDIDVLMHRTEGRPLVTGIISPRAALVFGLALGVGSTVFFWVTTNEPAALLSLSAIVMYVVGYTMILKRRTSQNIVWGGAAGCMPVLIGWAAVTGGLSWAPLVLFAIIFFWTPPHYWPLSMRFRDDYRNAGVPMLPVVADIAVVGRQIVIYSWVMVAVSIALWPVAHTGPLYGVTAVVLGVVWLVEAHLLYARAKQPDGAVKPMRLFHWSITYLTLLFVALAADALIFTR